MLFSLPFKILREHPVSFFGIGSRLELSTNTEDFYMKYKRRAENILEVAMEKDPGLG